MSEPSGQFAESGEFVALLLAAGGFTDTIGKDANEALAEGGHTVEHFLE